MVDRSKALLHQLWRGSVSSIPAGDIHFHSLGAIKLQKLSLSNKRCPSFQIVSIMYQQYILIPLRMQRLLLLLLFARTVEVRQGLCSQTHAAHFKSCDDNIKSLVTHAASIVLVEMDQMKYSWLKGWSCFFFLLENIIQLVMCDSCESRSASQKHCSSILIFILGDKSTQSKRNDFFH